MEYPIEIATNLDDLMRFEYFVSEKKILPDRPIYSMLAGRHAARMRGRGLDFEEVRPYVAGDDIRNIDWRVTARTGTTYSKVFNEEKERPSFVIIDQSASMFFGSQRYVKSVTAAHVAALSAFYTIKRGDRFGGLIFNEDGYDYLAPKRSKALVEQFCQLMVTRNRQLPLRETLKPNTGLLNEMLQRARAVVTHDYVVAVIAELSYLNDESKQYLRSMAYHNNVMLIHIEDPMDKLLPDGRLVLSNGERQIMWNNRKNNWGEKYENSYNEWQDKLVEEFRHYKIPVAFFDTVLPVEQQIMQRLGRELL